MLGEQKNLVVRLSTSLLKFLGQELFHPSLLMMCIKDSLGIGYAIADTQEHVKSALNWLIHAQESTPDGGVSAGFFFQTGWQASFPETTGYIVPTMFDGYIFTNDEKYKRKAIEMSEWLVGIQLDNGAFQGGNLKDPAKPFVFNTGQILKGLVRAYMETGQDKFKNAAIRAGDFLVEVQNSDGAWKKFTYYETAHTYHTRVAWPLLNLFQITGNPSYKEAAKKNLEWTITNQKENGWFKNCSPEPLSNPFTHFIAYTTRGLLECGILFGNQHYVDAASRTADALLERFETEGFLRGTFDENWRSKDGYTCLTGDAQIAIIWLRIFQITRKNRYLDAAVQLTDFLKITQDTSSKDEDIKGAIKGAYPMYGRYYSFAFPNWATKFFIDALLLRAAVTKNIDVCARACCTLNARLESAH